MLGKEENVKDDNNPYAMLLGEEFEWDISRSTLAGCVIEGKSPKVNSRPGVNVRAGYIVNARRA